MDERRCPACRATVSPEAAFCVTCGAPQHHDAPEQAGPRWRALESLWVFLLHILVTLVIAGVLAVFIVDEDALSVATVVVNEFALLAVTLGWIGIRYGAPARTLGLTPVKPADIGAGVLAGFAGILVAGGIAAAVDAILEAVRGAPVKPPQQIELQADPSGALLFLLGLSVIVLAPIAEEIFFRGMLYKGLRRWATPVTAIVLSAVIFSLVHILPLVLLPIFALGLMLAWLVEKRTGLWAAIAAHMTFNAVNFAVLALDGRLS